MGNSAVDVTVPVAGNPTTISVRENFTTIKTEIEELQDRADDELSNRPLQVPQPPATLVTDEVLTWNGSAWVPQTVRQLHGKAFNAAAPTDGQQLRWNNTAGEWQAVTNQVKLTGDVTADGDASPAAGIAAKVVQIQGKAVVAEGANSPLAGQALVFDGNRWVPTSGGAAPQSIIFRSFSITPYDLHTWIPDGTEGMFAGEGTNILNAPDAGEWRFIGHCSSVAGEQLILALSGNGRENGRLLQKIKSGGVWSTWSDYSGNESAAFLSENLTPDGPPDTTDFTNGNNGPNNWETQWVASTAGLRLVYALTRPTIAGHWYRLDFTWYSGLPTTTAFLRTGPEETTGQQQVITILYPPSGQGNTQSYWTGIVSGAFTHLVFYPTQSQGPGSPRLREFNPDLAAELADTQPAAAAGWSTGDTGVHATFTHAATNTAELVYPLAQPTEVGQLYFLYWVLASTSGQYAVNVYLRTGPTVTAGQLAFGNEGDNRPNEVGWGNVKRAASAFTHVVVVPNTVFTGTFQLAHVCPVKVVESATARISSRIDAANFLVGTAAQPLDGGMNNLAIGTDAMILASAANRNLAVGQEALRSVAAGSNNVALGYRALRGLVGGTGNVAIGAYAMMAAMGSSNVAIGSSIGARLSSGASNVLIGNLIATQMTTGSNNVIIGAGQTGRANSTGSSIVAIGQNALQGATAYAATGQTCVGLGTASALTSGTYNTALGANALYAATTASNCVCVGYNAGRYRTGTTAETDMGTTGSIYIGHNSRSGGTTRVNQIVIGVDVDGAGSNTVTIGSAASTGSHRTQVAWTVGISDIRGKEQVEAANLDRCLQTVMALPVSRWKWRDFLKRPNQHEIGWLADDVAAVFPKSISICDERYGEHEIPDCKHHNANHEALPVLWGCVQRLVEKIEALEEKLNERK